MRVKMKETHESAVDGVTVREYKKGTRHDVPLAVGENWIRKGWASAVGRKAEEPEETKVIEPEETKEEELEEPIIEEPAEPEKKK